jgi:nitric oxide dioxygenase
MPAPLSAETLAIVKACVPALREHGLAVTLAMYKRLFADPSIRDLFNQSHQGEDASQPRALAGAILAYAENVENLGALAGAVERIAQRHAGLNILPEHYPAVATALLGALQDVLGDAATPEVLGAWGEAYWFLANILIEREAQIYREHAEAKGGWSGWRDFVVERVVQESTTVKSFYLKPKDGGGVLRHKPGQFLTFRFELPGHEGVLKRNYSISSGPNDEFYRISVKREPAPVGQPEAPAGLISGWLHDNAKPGTVLSVAPPAGEFVLDAGPATPVVLLSGGVGLTPMVSMMEALAEVEPVPAVWWVHGTLNGRTHAMSEHVRELAVKNGAKPVAFYAEPEADDLKGRHYDEQGFITVDWLKANVPFEDAIFYLCGPKPFLRALVGGLNRAGVPASRLRYEFFGPTDELLAA